MSYYKDIRTIFQQLNVLNGLNSFAHYCQPLQQKTEYTPVLDEEQQVDRGPC